MQTSGPKAAACRSSRARRRCAFTLIEVLAIIITLVLLLALLLPALIKARATAARMACAANLKSVSLGFLTWVHDHDYGNLPALTPVANQGNQAPLGVGDPSPFSNPSLERNQAYWQFAFISNELSDPRFLVCPADRKLGLPRKLARNFGADPNAAGLMAAGFRNRACSYALDVDVFLQGSFALTDLRQSLPRILSMDRNILWDSQNNRCSSGVGTAQQLNSGLTNFGGPVTAAQWTNSIHGNRGNVLRPDGSMQNCNNEELDALASDAFDSEGNHFLVPE